MIIHNLPRDVIPSSIHQFHHSLLIIIGDEVVVEIHIHGDRQNG